MYKRNQEAIEHEALMKAIEETGEETPCVNFPDAYFVEVTELNGTHYRDLAVALCETCPIKNLCAEYGIRWEPDFGIWGGLRPVDRRKLRRAAIAAGREMPNLQVENAYRGSLDASTPEALLAG